MFAFGVVLFALAIGVSIMLHEAGHMVSAKAYGMKVTQYFVGFGPTLWSFTRGETEYGLKLIPAGGFCRIEGMTPLEDGTRLGPHEQHRAFYRGKLWQRTVVLAAGSITHFILGIAIVFICALFVGLPNPAYTQAVNRINTNADAQPAYVDSIASCLLPYDKSDPDGTRACSTSDPTSPAAQAGIVAGDKIVGLGSKPVTNWGDVRTLTKALKPGTSTLSYVHDGRTVTRKVTFHSVKHAVGGSVSKPTLSTTPVVGISLGVGPIPLTRTYGPVDSIGQTASFTGTLFTGTFAAIGRFPEKIPKLVSALEGKPRDPNGPISIYGASRAGGQVLAQGGAEGPTAFLLILASLNVFIGIFNLFPLLPLDGGHVAIAWFERVRARIAARRGRPDPGRVDYNKLLPVTYVVVLVFGAISVLTIAADIVNPINLFPK